MKSLYPEHELLIQLTSPSPSREDILPLLFQEEMDWDFLFNEAGAHGVSALLDESIKKLHLEDIFPLSFRNNLSLTRQQIGLHKLFLHQETKGMLNRFQEAGIDSILYKGATLVDDVYGDASLRPSSDIDVLVSKKDLESVQEIMFDLGFTFPKEMLNTRFYYRHHFHVAYIKKLKNCTIMIEVHWHLMDQYLLLATDLTEIWNRKIPYTFEESPSHKLSLDDECIYLALHAFKHGFMNRLIAKGENHLCQFFHPFAENKLMWFVDLQKIILKYGDQISWKTIDERTSTWGVDESVRSIYLILNKIYPNLTIPQSYLKDKNSISISRLKSVLFKSILKTPQTKGRSEPQKGFAGFLQKHIFTMQSDVEFRLIRIIDIFEYLFPNLNSIQRLYKMKKFTAILMYPVHFIKTFIEHFLGLTEWIYYTLRKRIN